MSLDPVESVAVVDRGDVVFGMQVVKDLRAKMGVRAEDRDG